MKLQGGVTTGSILVVATLVGTVVTTMRAQSGPTTTSSNVSSRPLSRIDEQGRQLGALKAELASLRAGSEDRLMPVGAIMPFAGSTPPKGWLLCNGEPLDVAKYSDLAAVIGSTYGEQAGVPLLPDLRGRVAVGAGQGPTTTGRAVGTADGKESHKLTDKQMPLHDHGFNDPGHTHDNDGPREDRRGFISFAGAPKGPPRISGGIGLLPNRQGSGVSERDVTTAKTGITFRPEGGTESFSLMQPFLVTNYIIKY